MSLKLIFVSFLMLFLFSFGFAEIVYDCQELGYRATNELFVGSAKITDLWNNYVDVGDLTIKIDSGFLSNNPILLVKDGSNTIYKCRLPKEPKNYLKSFYLSLLDNEFIIEVNYSHSYFSSSGFWWLYAKTSNLEEYASNASDVSGNYNVFGKMKN